MAPATSARKSSRIAAHPSRSDPGAVSPSSHAIRKGTTNTDSNIQQQIVPIVRLVRVFAPKIVTTDAANFRAIVQKLTGNIENAVVDECAPVRSAGQLQVDRRIRTSSAQQDLFRSYSTPPVSSHAIHLSDTIVPIDDKSIQYMSRLPFEVLTPSASSNSNDACDGAAAATKPSISPQCAAAAPSITNAPSSPMSFNSTSMSPSSPSGSLCSSTLSSSATNLMSSTPTKVSLINPPSSLMLTSPSPIPTSPSYKSPIPNVAFQSSPSLSLSLASTLSQNHGSISSPISSPRLRHDHSSFSAIISNPLVHGSTTPYNCNIARALNDSQLSSESSSSTTSFPLVDIIEPCFPTSLNNMEYDSFEAPILSEVGRNHVHIDHEFYRLYPAVYPPQSNFCRRTNIEEDEASLFNEFDAMLSSIILPNF